MLRPLGRESVPSESRITAFHPTNGWPGVVRSYALALLIFAAAVVFRIVLDYVVPERLPFITFFPAVLLAAYYCGLGPSILVLVLSAVTGTVWAEPSGSATVAFYAVAFFLFAVTGGVIVALVHYLMTTLQRLKQRDEQLAVINRELKHRIKNLFSIANSVCLQTLRSKTTTEEMSKAVSGRIMAIAAAQDLLSVEAATGAELTQLVSALVATLTPEPERLVTAGRPVTLSAQSTTPFALILHELGTNALKYGAWSRESGCVRVSWKIDEETLDFTWREHDGPSIAPTLNEGLGRSLIKNSLPGAVVSHDLKADGLKCHIRLPLVDENKLRFN